MTKREQRLIVARKFGVGPETWAIFIDNILFVKDLTRGQIAYHKKVALEVLAKDEARQRARALTLGPKRKPRMPKPWAPRRLRWQPPRPR